MTETAKGGQEHKQRPEAQEIERKFLVANLPPDYESMPSKIIMQGYLAISEDKTEVRLRHASQHSGDKYFQTVKSGIGGTRQEREVEITKEQFETLWPATEGKRVDKTRYEIPWGDATIELDIYQGQLRGLVVAEVEFDSEESAAQFQPPDWFGQDVTKDPAFKNQFLALSGRP